MEEKYYNPEAVKDFDAEIFHFEETMKYLFVLLHDSENEELKNKIDTSDLKYLTPELEEAFENCIYSMRDCISTYDFYNRKGAINNYKGFMKEMEEKLKAEK